MARPKRSPKRSRNDNDDGSRSPLQHLSDLAMIETLKHDLQIAQNARKEAERKLNAAESRQKKHNKEMKAINDTLRKANEELCQKYDQAMATNVKNGKKYEALEARLAKTKSMQHVDITGFDVEPTERYVDGPICGDIILWVKSFGPKMGGENSSWERAIPYVLIKRKGWNSFVCKRLTREDGKVFDYEEEVIDVSVDTWKFLKTNGPVKGECINLMKNFQIGSTVNASYPNWVNGVEDPVFPENSKEEEFSKAVITQIEGDRVFLHWDSDPWEFFAEVGVERLVKPFSNSESECHAFKAAHEDYVKLMNIPPNCRNIDMKKVYAIIEAKYDEKNTLTGRWEVFDEKSSTKNKWEANMLVDEDSYQILHASYERIDKREHATIVLNSFKADGDWKLFTGKSTSKVGDGVLESILRGGIRGRQLYIQVHECFC